MVRTNKLFVYKPYIFSFVCTICKKLLSANKNQGKIAYRLHKYSALYSITKDPSKSTQKPQHRKNKKTVRFSDAQSALSVRISPFFPQFSARMRQALIASFPG